MPRHSSEAFVLGARKLGEADRLITFLTVDEGRMRGVAKSALRSFKRFGASLELLTRVQVHYFRKEHSDLARIESCDILDSPFGLVTEPLMLYYLAYFAELADQFSREQAEDPRFFRLLKLTLRGLGEGVDPEVAARYYEFWTLRLHGVFPSLGSCGGCGRALGVGGARLSEAEGLLCAECGRSRTGPSLSAAGRELLVRFARTSLLELGEPRPDRARLGELEGASQHLLRSFLERPLISYQQLSRMRPSLRGKAVEPE